MTEYCDINKLSELLNPTRNDSDYEDEQQDYNDVDIEQGQAPKKTPTKVSPYSKIVNEVKKPERNKTSSKVNDYSEDQEFEFEEEQKDQHKGDWKKTPQWDITYRQQLTPSDIYFQMGLKTPATASCEDMIVTIHLPEEQRQNMDLKILKDKLNLSSPKFYLDLKLPQQVDPQKGNAQWDADAQKLTVTLKMERELDLVNF